MNNDTNAVDPNQTAATGTTVAPTVAEEDAEAKIARLEAEKERITLERDNYKTGLLKAKGKLLADSSNLELTDDDRLRTIAREELANSELARIAEEQDGIIKATLKENKELKLALGSKTTVPVAVGSHTESTVVRTDNLISSDQMAKFKAQGKDDKWIEAYKRNLLRNGGRAA